MTQLALPWLVFFDTTELKAGRVPKSEIGAPMYIPELVIEERFVQISEDGIGKLRKLVDGEKLYQLGSKPLVSTQSPAEFRADFEEYLAQHGFYRGEEHRGTGVLISPVDTITIDKEFQLEWFRARSHKAFKDLAIALSIIAYVRKQDRRACIVVTGDDGFPSHCLRNLAQRQNVWLTVLKFDKLEVTLKQQPEILKQFSAFIIDQTPTVNAYLNEPQTKTEILIPLIRHAKEQQIATDEQLLAFQRFVPRSPDADAVTLTSHWIEALPLDVPREDENVAVALRFNFNVDVPGILSRFYPAKATAEVLFKGGQFVAPLKITEFIPSASPAG